MLKPSDVLKIKDITEIRRLSLNDFAGRLMTEEEFRHIFGLCDALWLHSGDPKNPHAELTSGNCSNGFVDCLRALRFTNLCEIMAEQLLNKARRDAKEVSNLSGVKRELWGRLIDWVVGSDHAGAAFSHGVATLLGTQHDFCEKGADKTQLWKRFTIGPDEVVLQVEELMTTSGTLMAVRQGIRQAHPDYPIQFAPLSLVLVHRSDVYEIERAPVVYLFHFDIKVWEPANCPLCQQGSRRLRPKHKQHWAELTGKS